MIKLTSSSDKRLIVEGKVNGKTAYFLIDTGASVGLINYDQRKKYGLQKGKSYAGTIVGAGGEMNDIYHCNTFVHIEQKIIPLFLLTNIDSVVESIKRETGIDILGIISLPLMKMCRMKIDTYNMEVTIE